MRSRGKRMVDSPMVAIGAKTPRSQPVTRGVAFGDPFAPEAPCLAWRRRATDAVIAYVLVRGHGLWTHGGAGLAGMTALFKRVVADAASRSGRFREAVRELGA